MDLHDHTVRVALTILFFFYLGLAKAQTNYYIDTAGSDAAAGTSTGTAWKTIAKVNASTFAAGSVINFKRGHTWREALVVPSSGSSGSPIIIGAYGTGNKPVISGLTRLLTWVNEGSNIWAAAFNAGAVNSTTKEFLMTVVRNGRLTAQGRWPNISYPEKGYLHQESHTTYTVTDNQLTGTPSWIGGQYVTRAEDFTIFKARITGHSTNTLTHIGNFYAPKDGWGYFIQNHPATLDSLGEWYYDSTATKLKMYSTSDPNSIGSGVQAAGINNLVTITSKSYIILANIRFEGADENAIQMTSASNIEIQNCEFEWASHSAIAATFTTNTNIHDNTFRNLNGSGIFMESECNGTTIHNNIFQTIGMIPGMSMGVDKHGSAIVLGQLASSSSTLTVTSNTIDSAGNNGIVFSGKNALIKNNIISNFSQVLGDFGGIYTGSGDAYYGAGGSRIIESNILLNSGKPWEGTNHTSLAAHTPSVKGIYIDEPSDHYTVKNNTVAAVDQAGLFFHRSTDMTVTGNTFYNNGSQLFWLNHINAPTAVRNLNIKSNVLFSKTVDQPVIHWWVYQSDISLWGAIDTNYIQNPFRQYGLMDYQNMSNGKIIYHDINSWRSYYPAHDANSVYNANTLSQYGSVAWAANAGTNVTTITTSNWDELFLWNVPAGLTVGQKYRVRFSIKSNTTAKANLIVNFFQQSPNIVFYAPLETTLRNVDFMFTANATGGLISLRQSDELSLCNYTISNIIIDRVTGTTPVDSVRFEYNTTLTDKHYNTNGRYKDAKGNTQVNAFTLNPFTSKVLVQDRSFTNPTYGKITALYKEYTYDLRGMEGEGGGNPFGLVNGGYDPKNGVTTLGTPLDDANLKTSIHPSTKAYVYNSEIYGSQIDFDLKINYALSEIWLYDWGFNADSVYILSGDWNAWDTLVAYKTSGQPADWGWKSFLVTTTATHKIRVHFKNTPYSIDASDGVAEITEMVFYGNPSGTPPVRPSTVYSGARQPAPTVRDFLWINTWKEIRDMKWWKPFGGVRLYKHREWSDTAAVNTFPTKVYREDPFPSDIDSLQVRNYTQYLKNMGVKTYISYKEAPQYIRNATGGEGRVFVTDIYGQDPRNKNYYRTDSMFMNHKAKLYGSKVYSLDSVYISDVPEFSGLNTMLEIQIGNEEMAWSNPVYVDPPIEAAHTVKAYEGIKQADTATKVIMSPYTKPDTSALKVQYYALRMVGDSTKQYYDGGIAYHQYQFKGQNEFPATNVYDAGPTKLYGEFPEKFDFLKRARAIREATYRMAGNVPLFIDEFNWNRNQASPFRVPLISGLDAASSQGCLLVKTLNYGLFAGLDRMAIYWMVNDVGDGGGGIFDAMGLMDAPPPLFSEIPFDSYYWVATFGNVLANYKPSTMDTSGAVWKFKYVHKTLSDSVAYFIAKKDTGTVTLNYDLTTGSLAGAKLVKFSDTRDTGWQSVVTAVAGVITIDSIGYIPKMILVKEGTPPANVDPVANAGTDITITAPTASVMLNGSASYDPDGTIASYAWTKLSGPAYSINNPAIASPTLSTLVAGTYVFRLTVTDNLGASHTDNVTVTVNPAIILDTDTIRVPGRIIIDN